MDLRKILKFLHINFSNLQYENSNLKEKMKEIDKAIEKQEEKLFQTSFVNEP